MTTEERKEEILTTCPTLHSKQYFFEQQLQSIGVWSGCRGFSLRDNRYVNEHVQWAWEQFQAKD